MVRSPSRSHAPLVAHARLGTSRGHSSRTHPSGPLPSAKAGMGLPSCRRLGLCGEAIRTELSGTPSWHSLRNDYEVWFLGRVYYFRISCHRRMSRGVARRDIVEKEE